MTKDEARTLVEKEKAEIVELEEQIRAKRLRIREITKEMKLRGDDDQRWRGYGEHLSPRHIEVIREVMKGKSSKSIGETLFVSEKTVKFHLTAIYAKLGIKTRSQLIVLMQMEPEILVNRIRGGDRVRMSVIGRSA